MSTLSKFVNAAKNPFLQLAKAYNRTAQKSPLGTGMVTTVVKTSAADLFAQKVVEGRDEIDLRRHGMFCAFGLFYLGGFQYYLYNHLFSRWCKTITATVGHRGSAPVKTFIDQFIHHPFGYFPTFYLLKGAVEGRPLDVTIDKYKNELWDNCKALWLLWVPAQLVNFSMVPHHLRIPFVAGVSFAWTVIISVMRGALDGTNASQVLEAAGETTEHLKQAVCELPAAAKAAAASGSSVMLPSAAADAVKS